MWTLTKASLPKMKCPVKTCKNSPSKVASIHISWHTFPGKNDPRRKAWLELCEKEEYGPSMRMCSEHFHSTDYFDFSKKKRALKPNAVPKG